MGRAQTHIGREGSPEDKFFLAQEGTNTLADSPAAAHTDYTNNLLKTEEY